MKKRIIATNKTIHDIVKQEIEKYGNKADLNHIDVSKVTNMSCMFYESDFNGDISNWNVSNVTDMYSMFMYSKFNGDISKWNVSNVTDMSSMFYESVFNGDISSWNVYHVIDMREMFKYSRFNKSIRNWNVSNGTNMHDMFYGSDFTRAISKWGLYDVPPVGTEIIGWKKCKDNVLVKLKIPADARRSCASTNKTKKCRAETAIVLAIEDINGRSVKKAVSKYDSKFTYHVGDIKHIDNFNPCKWYECAPGIHFFENKIDAINY